jgi:hypothetical protein
MAGRDSANKQSRNGTARRCGVVMVGALGAFVAAAAMATGSAAPARADFEELLDPIIQPLLTSLTDSLGGFDPAAATDITSWTDSLLSSLNSIDLALPLTAEPAAAVAAGAEPADSTATIPLTVLEGTEPAVNASIDGGSSVPLLVDTGSAGLVVPWQDLGSGSELQDLLSLGLPSSFGESGYSGGVDYIYLTYNNVPVDYLGGTGLATDGPVDVEVYSWDPSNLGSLFSNDAYQTFLGDNKVDGILGIADNASGPTTSPFADYGGVLVDIPQNQLVVSATDPLESYASTSGAPISTVLESVNNGTATSVSNDIDSGGVFGTIPSSLVSGSSVPSGTVITVDNAAGQQLYTYPTTGNFDVGTGTGVSDAPTVVSGTSIDSGVIPFLSHPVYVDYTNDTLYFDTLTPAT